MKKLKLVKQGAVYILKVQYSKDVWRKIKIGEFSTLDDLHFAILDSFDFDADHLYEFFMDNKAWSDVESYSSPYREEGPFANKVTIGKLGLKKGRKFMYLFDFGDEWRFTVTVDKVEEGIISEPVETEREGEAPEQYPDYDDEEEFDECDEDE